MTFGKWLTLIGTTIRFWAFPKIEVDLLSRNYTAVVGAMLLQFVDLIELCRNMKLAVTFKRL